MYSGRLKCVSNGVTAGETSGVNASFGEVSKARGRKGPRCVPLALSSAFGMCRTWSAAADHAHNIAFPHYASQCYLESAAQCGSAEQSSFDVVLGRCVAAAVGAEAVDIVSEHQSAGGCYLTNRPHDWRSGH